jgi:hypothetical protein
MTPYEQATKGADELATIAQEVLANTNAVRGQHFSNAAAAGFELLQLIDIFERLSGALREDKLIVNMCNAGIELSVAIGSKTTADLSEAEIEEALGLSRQLFSRRERLLSDLKKA